MTSQDTARSILQNGAERNVSDRQPSEDQMAVLISNKTPYVIWRVNGGLVGACKSSQEAVAIMRDLKSDFPDKDYICRDVDGDLYSDTRTWMNHD